MAIAGSNLTTSNGGASAAATFDTASISPGSDRLILATVAAIDGSFTTPPTFSLSGNGLTWVSVEIRQTGILTIQTFRAMGSSPSSGAVTISSDRSTILYCQWSISEFTGINTTGTNGSGAIGNSADNETLTASSLSVTLPAFGSASNGTYGAFNAYNDLSTAFTFTPGTGFTEIAETSLSDGTLRDGLQSQWRADNDTSVDMTTTTTNDFLAGIAIEIVAASGASSNGAARHYYAQQM